MKPKTSFLPFVMIGLVIGGILSQLIQYLPDHFLFTIIPYYNNKYHFQIPTLYYFWIAFYGLMILLAYTKRQSYFKLFCCTLLPSFLAAIPFAWSSSGSTSQFFLLVFSSFALNAFNIAYQSNSFAYSDFFYALWDSFVNSLISFFFMVLAWIILYATAELFSVIHVTIIQTLINKSSVDVFLTTLFLSIGFWIPTQIDGVVNGIRSLIFTSCRYLFIPLSVIGILFIITLLVTKQFHFNDSHVFLFIPFVCVIFLNAIYQDGLQDHSYQGVLHWLAVLFLCLTPVFTALAIYAIYYFGNHSIHDHGLTVRNFPLLVNSILLLCYNLIYAAVSLSKQKPWLKNIEKSNLFLALLLITITLITTNPWVINCLER